MAAPATSKAGMLSAHPGLFLSYPAAAQCRRTSLSGEGPGAGSLRPRAALLGSLTPGPLPNRRKKPAAPLACGFLVPVTGIEPVRCFHRQILSLLRLPISPHRQILAHLVYHSPQENAREAQRNQASLGNMIQLWGAAPSRPKSHLRRLTTKRACGQLWGAAPPLPLRDFPPRESHQSAPGALPIRAGSPRTPVCPKDQANRPRRRVPRRDHLG